MDMDQLRVERLVTPPPCAAPLQLRICSPLAGIANGGPLSTTFGPNSCGKHKSAEKRTTNPKKKEPTTKTQSRTSHRNSYMVSSRSSKNNNTYDNNNDQKTKSEHSDVGSMRRLGAFGAFFWPSKLLWPKLRKKRKKRQCGSSTLAPAMGSTPVEICVASGQSQCQD